MKNREELLQSKTKNNGVKKGMIPLTIDFSRALPNIHKILKSNAIILENYPEIKDAICNKTYISFRRQENLKDILVHKKHNKVFYQQNHGTTTCGRIKCTLCKFIKVSKEFEDMEGNVFFHEGAN